MKSWPTKKLGEVCHIYGGDAAPQDKSLFKSGSVPFVRMQDLGRYHTTTDLKDTVDKLTTGAIQKLGLKIWKRGVILVPRSGSVYMNHRAILGTDAVVVSHVAILSDFSKEILPRYLFHYLTIVDMGRYGTKTTGIDSISFSQMGKIKIWIPPLQIQKQIVERLDKIVETQKLNDALIQKADELFQSLLYRELHPAGKNWGNKKLGEVCEINPPKAEINKLPENTVVNFLAMADVSENAEVIKWQEKKLSKVKNGFTFFKDGDVLVAKITPCFENGKGAFIENMKRIVGFGSTEFHILRANPQILSNQFLYYIVGDKKFRKNGAKFMTGSAGQQRIPKQYFKNFKISLPPLEIQKQIVAKLSAVQDYKNQLLEQKAKLKELFDSALHKSMNE